MPGPGIDDRPLQAALGVAGAEDDVVPAVVGPGAPSVSAVETHVRSVGAVAGGGVVTGTVVDVEPDPSVVAVWSEAGGVGFAGAMGAGALRPSGDKVSPSS